MHTILIVTHVLVCFFLVVIVLLQHGKGADMGATFGGSSQTVFGTEGPMPLLNKVTTGSAVLFMVTSLSLAYLSANMSTGSVMSDLATPKPAGNALERAVEPIPQPDVQLGTEQAAPQAVEETVSEQSQPTEKATAETTTDSPATNFEKKIVEENKKATTPVEQK
ncbi:MAG: preprotein translocase subunit SecG [Thermodesulfobacteriota bacterium]|nr:preprotein translocase subunit SecG [Thermodesulfobacteriota bacterium]